MSDKKLILTLRDLNLNMIHKKYNISPNSDSSYNNSHLSSQPLLQQPLTQPITEYKSTINQTTSIDDILKTTPTQTISFLDEAHSSHVFNVSIINKDTKSKYHCFWDHHPFDTYPVYCPITYNCDKLEKNYFSYSSKNVYKIKEDIINNFDSTNLTNDSHNHFTLIKNAEFITDGVFCSFNCVQAFIDENKHNPLYNFSTVLLMKIYNQIFPHEPIKNIINAPHWRMLNVYGGTKTIKEFRNSFNTIQHTFSSTISFNSIAHLFEEKIRLN